MHKFHFFNHNKADSWIKLQLNAFAMNSLKLILEKKVSSKNIITNHKQCKRLINQR